MRPPVFRALNARRLLIGAAVAGIVVVGACPGLRARALPGCPRCGDPLTVPGPDGLAHVRCRLRIPDDLAAGPSRVADDTLPFAVGRSEAPR